MRRSVSLGGLVALLCGSSAFAQVLPSVQGAGGPVQADPTITAVGAGAFSPPVATGVTSALVAKASAGNLYRYGVTSGATAGYVVLNNTTAAPAASGATTPLYCQAVAANTSIMVGMGNIPVRFSTGLVILFSASCTTYTAVTPVLISAEVQ